MKYDLEGVCQDCIYLEKIRPLFDEKDKEIERLCNALNEVIERNSKAIEFIEEHNIIGTNKEYLPSEIEKCYSLELMEILQGSDKSEDIK